jgi:hypothetical protein
MWLRASAWRQASITLGVVGALTLLFLLPIRNHRQVPPQRPIQVRHVLPTVAREPGGADSSTFKAFALNALLIPVLDDDVPSRWTEPFALMSCVKADLLVDGKPVAFGSAVPATAFEMHWSMDHCTAFGEAMVMSGTVDLLVFHDGDSYSAVVQPSDLRIDSSSGLMVLGQSFAASTPLGNRSPDASLLQLASSRLQSRSTLRRVPVTGTAHAAPRLELPGSALSHARHRSSRQ